MFVNNAAASKRRFSAEFMEDIAKKYSEREDFDAVVRQGYVQGGVSSKVQAARQALNRGLLENKMSSFLKERPDMEELLRQNILEDAYNAGVAPSIQKAQKEFEAARRKDAVTRSLARRSDKDDLVSRNIIRDEHMASSQREALNNLRRAMVEDKIAKSMGENLRPSRKELVDRGIIVADATDKVLDLDGDEAREVLLRLAARGGLWAEAIKAEASQVLGEEEADYEKLNRKISRRPSLDDMRSSNILKQRGADPKLVATRNLKKQLAARPDISSLESSGIFLHEAIPMRRRSIDLERELAARTDRTELVSRGIIRSPSSTSRK